jgi:glutaminase
MSIAAATLANGGICPISEDRIFSHSTVKNCLSLMASCGMYDFSGEFAFTVGLPAKSGVGGGLLIVIPNVMGITVWSPPLDEMGNSVRGVEFCRQLTDTYNFHNFDCHVNSAQSKKDPRSSHNHKDDPLSIFWAVANNKFEILQKSLESGADPNQQDYSGKTLLHIAVARSNIKIITLLLERGALTSVKDALGQTPENDAILYKNEHVLEVLRSH